jgi:N-methylhydantoinase B/oxoprolinase/acetone carboxylase alpha subunit
MNGKAGLKTAEKSKGRSLPSEETLDPLTVEIMRRHLISTVEEMVRTTTRTAYSTCFSEALDFSCALFNARGKLIAQAAGIPIHVGAMGDVLDNVFEHYPAFEPGDVVIHNDPYHGGTHQADVAVIRPMFHEHVLVGFAVNRGHWVDIGGMTAGGWGGNASHVIQEALLIPAVKLYRRGDLVPEVRDLVLRNVRMPKQAWGDLQSQIASAITAERRVSALCTRYGREAVTMAGDRAIEYSRTRFRKMLSRIPDGEYEAQDWMDNDGRTSDPCLIRLRISKTGSTLSVDLTGTSPQVRGPINSTWAATKAGVMTALINVIDPDVPINAGCLDEVKIHAPEATMVNPVYPAPVFAGLADTAARVCETVFKALAAAVPDRVAAGSYATGNNTTGWGTFLDRTEFVWYSFGPGGCGARSGADGNSADWDPRASCRNESAEIWENRYPLRVTDFRLRTDSGGPGQWRGGLGHVKALQLLEDTSLSACVDRNVIPPFGLFGGIDGQCNRLTLQVGGEELGFQERFGFPSPSKFANVRVPKGATYRIYSGGGGGFGSPLDRPVEKVVADVRAGYVSVDAARVDYGVVVDPVSHVLDEGATESLRSSR